MNTSVYRSISPCIYTSAAFLALSHMAGHTHINYKYIHRFNPSYIHMFHIHLYTHTHICYKYVYLSIYLSMHLYTNHSPCSFAPGRWVAAQRASSLSLSLSLSISLSLSLSLYIYIYIYIYVYMYIYTYTINASIYISFHAAIYQPPTFEHLIGGRPRRQLGAARATHIYIYTG